MKALAVVIALVVLMAILTTFSSCATPVEKQVHSTSLVAIEHLAEQVASVYRTATAMRVEAKIVQHLEESPDTTREIVCVSEMAHGRFLLKVFLGQDQVQPVAEFSLLQGRMEEVRFDRVPAGEDEYYESDALKPYGDGYIQFWDSCIFGSFLQTWVGPQSGIADKFSSIIKEGVLIGEGAVNGQGCYVVEKRYEWSNGKHSLERLHIDKQTFLVLKWEMRHFDGYDQPMWRVRTLRTSTNTFDPDGSDRTWRVARQR